MINVAEKTVWRWQIYRRDWLYLIGIWIKFHSEFENVYLTNEPESNLQSIPFAYSILSTQSHFSGYIRVLSHHMTRHQKPIRSVLAVDICSNLRIGTNETYRFSHNVYFSVHFYNLLHFSLSHFSISISQPITILFNYSLRPKDWWYCNQQDDLLCIVFKSTEYYAWQIRNIVN